MPVGARNDPTRPHHPGVLPFGRQSPVGEFVAPENQKSFTTMRRAAVVPFAIREAQEAVFDQGVRLTIEQAIWSRDPRPVSAFLVPGAGGVLFSNVYDLSKAQGGEFRKDVAPIARPNTPGSGLNVNVGATPGQNGNADNGHAPQPNGKSGWRKR